MQQLRARLAERGFPNISFYIMTSKMNINLNGVAKLREHAGDIPVVEEPEEMNPTWQPLLEGSGGIDNVFVIDRCGRLAYQVISPWSLFHYPYVKAAILSAYNDDPCGPCHLNDIKESMEVDNVTLNIPEMQSTKKSVEAVEDVFSGITPTIQTAHETLPSQIPTSENVTGGSTLKKSTYNATEFPEITDDVSSPEEFDSADIESNIVMNESVRPKISTLHLSELDQIDKTNDELMSESDSMMAENELDATLSPLVERKDGTVPITVIIPSNHKHRRVDGTISQHDYLVLQTGNPDYHGHLESEEYLEAAPTQETDWEEKVNYKKEKERKEHNALKTADSEEARENLEIAQENYPKKLKYKGMKYQKKKIPHGSEENDESNENSDEKLMEIKKYKDKKNKHKIQKEITSNIGSKEEKISETLIPKCKKIKNIKCSEEEPGTVKNKLKPLRNQKSSSETSEIEDVENTEERFLEKIQQSEEKDSAEVVTEASDVSQDMKKHLRVSDNNTLHLDKIKHIQKTERPHSTESCAANTTDTNLNGSLDLNEKNSTGEPVTSSADDIYLKNITVLEHRRPNTNSLNKVDIHKKTYNKKVKVSVLNNSVTSTLAPIPIKWNVTHKTNINEGADISESFVPKVVEGKGLGSSKPVHTMIYDTAENHNTVDDGGYPKTIEEVAIEDHMIAGKVEPTTSSSEENNSDVMYEDIIKHYSKLIKWLGYIL